MAYPKLPDWLIYAVAAGAVVLVADARREKADAPPAPPPPDIEEGALVGPMAPINPRALVSAPELPPGSASGTAFSVAASGRWITARHVVDGCRQAAILLGGGQAVAARPEPLGGPADDLALLVTAGGSTALPVLRDPAGLKAGARAYLPGFPGGAPGEVAVRMIRRKTLWVRRRGVGAPEPVVTWAEVGRTDGLQGSLAGLSGGPLLDEQGRVVGVALAEQPRRGLLYSTGADSLARFARDQAHAREVAVGDRITTDNYGRIADGLRRDLRVARVACLDG